MKLDPVAKEHETPEGMPSESNALAKTRVGRASLPAFSPSAPLEPVLTKYYRRLPHWRLTGATYFVTWRLHQGQCLLNEDERSIVLSAMMHFDSEHYNLYAWVVMDDHVHAIVKPRGGYPLEAILHSWKSFTARQLQNEFDRMGSIWQDESFDRVVRDEGELEEKVNYILQNPTRRWPEITDDIWSGCQNCD